MWIQTCEFIHVKLYMWVHTFLLCQQHYLPTAMHVGVHKLVLRLLMVLSFLASNFVAWMVASSSRMVDPLVSLVNNRNALLSVLAKLRFAQLMPLLKILLTSAIFARVSPKMVTPSSILILLQNCSTTMTPVLDSHTAWLLRLLLILSSARTRFANGCKTRPLMWFMLQGN